MSTTQQTKRYASRVAGLFCSREQIGRAHLARVFWGLMAISHAPAVSSYGNKLATTGFAWSDIGSCLLLAASMTFFLLKVIDVRFLRFHLTKRSAIALCVLVAFMHFDAIRAGDDPTLIPQFTALIAATTIVSRSVAPRRDLFVSGAHEHHTNTLLSHDLRPTETVWTGVSRPHCWARSMRIFALRAPPC